MDKVALAMDAPAQYKGCYWGQYGQDTICFNTDHITYYFFQVLGNRG